MDAGCWYAAHLIRVVATSKCAPPPSSFPDKLQWNSVTVQGPAPLPRSLHTAVVIKNRLFVLGGWVPVLVEDGSLPAHETEWRCTNTLACLNLGEGPALADWLFAGDREEGSLVWGCSVLCNC